MNTIKLAGAAAAIATIFLVAPTLAGTIRLATDTAADSTHSPQSWRGDSDADGCRILMQWKRDYGGNLYPKKKRVCA